MPNGKRKNTSLIKVQPDITRVAWIRLRTTQIQQQIMCGRYFPIGEIISQSLTETLNAVAGETDPALWPQFRAQLAEGPQDEAPEAEPEPIEAASAPLVMGAGSHNLRAKRRKAG